MPSRRALGPAVLVAASMSWGCAASPPPAAAPPPSHGAHEPEVEHTFVSTSNNDGARATRSARADGGGTDCTVTTPDAAKALAETAVAEYLDPQKTWTTSPVLPSTWPTTKRTVVYFFYPMAANPRSMTHFQLFSAAWRVEVSLHDGTTAVAPVAKSREIGTIAQTRASSLERRELEIAEAALVQQLVGTDVDEGESPYWGYLKYMHEHPQLGKDLQRRSPAFLGWVRKRYGK
jgi:hypothetical protein